jgi:hypothetical protein
MYIGFVVLFKRAARDSKTKKMKKSEDRMSAGIFAELIA